jgi:5-methylcytosine-specific restriction protein A
MAERVVMCAGCSNKHPVSNTTFYRNKRWCGNKDCVSEIDRKVASYNYKKQQRKILKGTNRSGVSSELRSFIYQRDNNKCQECNLGFEMWESQVHHIIPVSNGGTDDTNNLILLCKSCHTKVHQDGCENYYDKYQRITKLERSKS